MIVQVALKYGRCFGEKIRIKYSFFFASKPIRTLRLEAEKLFLIMGRASVLIHLKIRDYF